MTDRTLSDGDQLYGEHRAAVEMMLQETQRTLIRFGIEASEINAARRMIMVPLLLDSSFWPEDQKRSEKTQLLYRDLLKVIGGGVPLGRTGFSMKDFVDYSVMPEEIHNLHTLTIDFSSRLFAGKDNIEQGKIEECLAHVDHAITSVAGIVKQYHDAYKNYQKSSLGETRADAKNINPEALR